MTTGDDSKSGEECLAKNRMRGMRIRDEFLCPITYDLLREPMVASDGHTYEKMAIEKWLKSDSPKSPLSGEVLVDKEIVENRTLKKLIQDLINEGGLGLYTADSAENSRIFDVYTERVLVLKCLGPPEASDWYQQAFQCGPRGIFGGRRARGGEVAAAVFSSTSNNQETVLFRDANVSRAHFEIKLLTPGKYGIRDLGSMGGTYVRIMFAAGGDRERGGRELHAGMIIMIGKHQFTVSSIDDSGIAIPSKTESSSSSSASAKFSGGRRGSETKGFSPDRRSPVPSSQSQPQSSHAEALQSVIEDAEHLVNRLSEQRRVGGRGGPQSPADKKSRMSGKGGGEEGGPASELQAAREMESYLMEISRRLEGLRAESKGGDSPSRDGRSSVPPLSPVSSNAMVFTGPYAERRCRLTCCAPEGSPLIGKGFVIGPNGATMGRRSSNDIALHLNGEGGAGAAAAGVQQIDSAISAEHAHIRMDGDTGAFYIHDGDAKGKKGSTNGTWYRLSGPTQESAFHPLAPGMEILITNIRFQVGEETTVLERNVKAGEAESESSSRSALANAVS